MSAAADSPLRLARKAAAKTLEQVCEDLDQRSEDGSAGVTPSMLSGWELGRHTTSMRFRALLSAYYGIPAGKLFAHQDLGLSGNAEAPVLLAGYRELRRAMAEVVDGAKEYLVATGSRTRDTEYLRAIEHALADRPELVHYRVLFGPPRNPTLGDHLERLLTIRDPQDRSLGIKTLHIGVASGSDVPERFFIASESAAVVPIPSLTSAAAFDSGVRLGPEAASRLVDHARQCYAAAQRAETLESLAELAGRTARAGKDGP
jgi:transcriptional regulator with XRE-family HTH domain